MSHTIKRSDVVYAGICKRNGGSLQSVVILNNGGVIEVLGDSASELYRQATGATGEIDAPEGLIEVKPTVLNPSVRL